MEVSLGGGQGRGLVMAPLRAFASNSEMRAVSCTENATQLRYLHMRALECDLCLGVTAAQHPFFCARRTTRAVIGRVQR